MKETVKLSWIAMCLLLASFIFTPDCYAQRRRTKGPNYKPINAPTFDAKLGFSQFFGDLQKTGLIGKPAPMLGLSATNHFHSLISGTFQFTAGQLKGERIYQTDGLGVEEFTGSVVDVNLTAAFNILEFSLDRRRSFLKQRPIERYNLYAFVGFGWSFYGAKASSGYNRLTGELVPYGVVREKKGGSTSHIPFGIGGRYRVTKTWSVGFEYTWKRLGVDDLDATELEWTDKKDWYGFSAVRAGYTILGKYRKRTGSRRTF